MKFRFYYIVLLLPLLWQCSTTKHLGEHQFLLNKNDVEIIAPLKLATKNISKDEILSLAKLQENKEILKFLHHKFKLPISIRPRLYIFDKFAGGKTTKFKWWVQHNIGEPYSLYDSVSVKKSAQAMQHYMFNKGYYDSQVDYVVKKKGKKANVTFIIRPKTLYIINDIKWFAENDTIQSILNQNKGNTFFKIGDAYDSQRTKEERERIEVLLRNSGYYDFSQEFVHFVVDTTPPVNKKNFFLLKLFSENNKPINIQVKVKNPDGGYHTQYHIQQVYVFPNFSIDTTVKYTVKDSMHLRNYIFIYKKSNIIPRAFLDKMFLETGAIYSLEKHQKTITRLAGLSMFKNVQVQFIKSGKNTLVSNIYLTPLKRRDYNFDIEASTNSEFGGGGVNFTYREKNIFKRADILSLNIKGSLESPFENTKNKLRTVDLGTQIGLTLPQFVLPFRKNLVDRNQNPKTKISLSYNYLKRLDYYSQYQTNFSFGYEWYESKRKHHSLYPVTFNFTQYYQPSDAFIALLNSNPLLKSSFEQHLIPGINYTFVYNTLSEMKKSKNPYYFKVNLDLAGNSFYLINQIKNNAENTPNEPLKFFSINYSQYAKFDLENRYTINLTKHQSFVVRQEMGAGLPYGYSDVLPYSKQFYSGGPNGLRGWRVRSLGPGAYKDNDASTLTLNQTGDSKLEGNAELRFDLIGYFKGALFVDAGNIWLLKKDSLRKDAEFDINKFYRQIAVDGGVGLRFDYNYFVIRFDVGIPLVDPTRIYAEQWMGDEIRVKEKAWRKTNLHYNLAIAYPF